MKMRALDSMLLMAVCLLIVLVCPAAAVSQGTAELAALKAAAAKGDANAQLAYAKALKNPADARIWAQKAAEQGLGEAWFWLGYNAPGDEALPFYEKAAERGYPEAFEYLLDRLLFRAGEKADVAKAKKFADLARTLKLDTFDADAVATIDRCASAGPANIPRADLATAAERAAFASGDCAYILEGIGQKANPQKYGRCVLSQDDRLNNDVAELYANGWGVKRNATTAIAFVCHGSDVPAELEGMVQALYETKDAAALDEPFRFCEHVTSGMNQGRCAAASSDLEEEKRGAAVRALAAAWPAPHKAALSVLQQAAEVFFTTRSTKELDMSGTARAAIAIGEQESLRDELAADIKAFEAGTLPKATDFKAADAQLNAVYATIMKKGDLDLGTVTSKGIRETQRAWLAFRDAWAALGAARYPSVPADTWKAWATVRRVAQLKALLEP